ncbi:methylmalonyl-CoA mutase subunit beta [Sutcliffiella rhizosphaerae]|uniref:methylmalonyl-CoA mutase n=1 Tax=Sutcliffiella rhizosphaerae TaxID=2880967 RepID=A0ABM8YTJ3_9BACI|nr:methylmalonyl-CoA mutase subunit beta [Sutcliffiella rhizosphaerae]CAG9623204.1 Fused isobutyryl-CoA mutase [Sutcliffiella rhizosphaerae]
MSKIKEMKNNCFPKSTLEDWEIQAERALKGKPVSKINSDTYEGIIRKPIYTEDDIKDIQTKASKEKGDWTVSQQLYGQVSLTEWNEQLKHELKNGLQAIHFISYPASDKNTLPIKDKSDFQVLFKEIDLQEIPLHVYTGTSVTTFLSAIHESEVDSSTLQGIIGADPIAELAATGMLNLPLNELVSHMKSNIKWKRVHIPSVKTIFIQSAPYHNGGANAVQELAATMATAVEYIQALIEMGLSIDEVASEVAFSFPVGSDFFMELAKLRAARILWANLIEAFGGSEKDQQMTLHATTSQFNKSTLDPYVNMLRTTTEAFSAALGGADSINIDSYQQEADVFSRRIARNTHYVLKEESFLSKVTDPAAGSYYVETLTHNLANAAWEMFQEIESLGGMVKALESNYLQDRILKIKEKRFKDVEKRRKVLIGTNMYADLKEELKEQRLIKTLKQEETAAEKIQAIQPVRLTASFENLRYQAKKYELTTGIKPKLTLINLGALATHKPRTDFASGFFQVGGITSKLSPSLEDTSALKDWLSAEKLEGHICICGSDDSYNEMLNEVVTSLKGSDRKILLAGLPDLSRQEELIALGISDFIHQRSNCFEQLSTIHEEMGLTEYEA